MSKSMGFSWALFIAMLIGDTLLLSCSGPGDVAAKVPATQGPAPSRQEGPTEAQPLQDASRGIKATETLPTGQPATEETAQKAQVSSKEKSVEFTAQIGDTLIGDAIMTPDGKNLITSGANGIKLWETASGRLISTRNDLHGTFSPDGRSLAWCVSERIDNVQTKHSIRVLDTSSAALHMTFAEYQGDGGWGLAFSADGKTLAGAVGYDMAVFDIASGKRLALIPKAMGPVALTPNGSGVIAVTANNDQVVCLWEVATGRQLLRFGTVSPPGFSAIAKEAHTSKDGKYVVVTTLHGALFTWNLTTGAPVQAPFLQHVLGPVAAFSCDSRYLVVGGEASLSSAPRPLDEAIVLFDLASGKRLRQFGRHPQLSSLRFTADDKYLISGGGGSAMLWDVASGTLVRTFEGFPFREISCVAASPDGTHILISGNDTNTRLVNLRTGTCVRRSMEPKGVVPDKSGFEPCYGQVHALAFSLDGTKAIVGGGSYMCGEPFAHIVEPSTGRVARTFKGPQGVVSGVALSADGTLATATDSNSNLFIWDSESGQQIKSQSLKDMMPQKGGTCSFPPAALSPHGKYAVALVDKLLTIIDTSSCTVLRSLPDVGLPPFWANRSPCSFNPAESILLVFNTRTNAFILVDPTTGSVLKSLNDDSHNNGYRDHVSTGFSPDGRYALTSGTEDTSIWEVESGKRIQVIPVDNGTLLCRENKSLFVSSSGGVIDVYDALTGDKIFSSVISFTDGEYLTWTPEGYYFGSDSASKSMVHLVRGSETFGIDQFFDRFYNPAMVQAKIMGYKVDAPHLDGVLASSPPPFVEITSPKMNADGKVTNDDGTVLTAGEVKVAVRALDTGGGVKDIRLYHDGKRLEDTGQQVTNQERTFEKTWTVNLIPGDNLLTAAAFSNEMLESTPFELIVPYGKSDEKPDLYSLVVGVNTYGNEAYNLKLAHPDAESFGKDLPEHAKTVFGTMHAKQLYDDQATKQGILAALAEIAGQAKPSDVFAFYFAGHGVVLEDTKQFYLATHGVSKLSSAAEPGSLVTEGITDQELKDALQKIPALKQVVFLDACHSGTADLVAQAMGASDEVVIKKLSRASGTWVFTAADKQQYALEQTDLGHGLFTYALLKGIAGEADAGARDGYVKLSELETYIAETVQKLATKLNRDQQPKIYKGGDDFSIALASGPPTVTQEKTPDTQAASAKRSVPRTAIITGDIVNVRSGPSTTDTALTQVKQGTQVEILEGPKDTWYKVKIDTQSSGWIRGDYLRIQ